MKKVDDAMTMYTRNHIFKQPSVGCSHAFRKKHRTVKQSRRHVSQQHFIASHFTYRAHLPYTGPSSAIGYSSFCSWSMLASQRNYRHILSLSGKFHIHLLLSQIFITSAIPLFWNTDRDSILSLVSTLFCVIKDQVVSEYIRYKSLDLFLGVHNNYKP